MSSDTVCFFNLSVNQNTTFMASLGKIIFSELSGRCEDSIYSQVCVNAAISTDLLLQQRFVPFIDRIDSRVVPADGCPKAISVLSEPRGHFNFGVCPSTLYRYSPSGQELGAN